MTRSIEMTPLKQPSLGKCIFCGDTENLTDEHIVPEALTGIGEMIIREGSCRKCNNDANKAYEGAAMANDFLPVRHMLQLRRKPRGKKTTPRRMPPVSLTATDDKGDTYNDELPPGNYPPIYTFVLHEPAGRLSGINRAAGHGELRLGFINLGLPEHVTPPSVAMRLPMIMGHPEMVVAKMAYCWAIAEKGLDAFDTTDLLDLLCGRRADIFNFVGSPIVSEQLPMLQLHEFYFRKRGELTTVLVHLFASFNGPIHEVVIGKEK